MHHDEQSEMKPTLEYPTHKQALTIIIITMLFTFAAGLSAVALGFTKTQLFLVEFFTIVPAVIFVIRRKFSLIKVFRLRPVNKIVIIWSILIGLSMTILADEIDRLIQLIFPMPDILLQAIQESLKINSVSDFLIITFSAVFLAAVCEELLFRGFLQTSFESTFDVTKAVMLTALIFAIIHFNPWWTIQLILFGTFLGVLAWKTNSVVPSMIVHFVNNGVALIFSNMGESQYEWYFWNEHVDPVLIGLALIIGIFGFKKLYSYYEVTTNGKDSNDSRYPEN